MHPNRPPQPNEPAQPDQPSYDRQGQNQPQQQSNQPPTQPQPTQQQPGQQQPGQQPYGQMPYGQPPYTVRPQPHPRQTGQYPSQQPTQRLQANQPPRGPQPSGLAALTANRPLMIGAIAAVAVVVVIAVVLVSVLNGSKTGSSGTLGPVAGGPQEAHGRRPVTQVEPSSGRTLTVAQDGSGQFKTIEEAAAQTKPGDTVVISAGTYSEALNVPTDGAQNAYITYQAAPGANVVIQGDTDNNGLVYMKGRNWIRFIGLTIQDSTEHGLYAVDSNHIVVQDTLVSNSQDGGMVFVDGSDVQVIHSEVRGSNAKGTDASNEAVTFSNIDGFEIAYSVVANCGEEGIDAKYEARNGKIHDNTSDANRGPNIYIDAANTIEVYNNTVTGATGDGKQGISLGIEDVSETRKTYAIKVYNNVVTGNKGGGIGFFVESEGTFSDIQIVNNTVVNNPGDGFNPRKYTFAGTNLLRNNIFSGNQRDITGQGDGFTIDHNLFATGGIGTDLVTGAVEFVNLAAGDLRLAAGSPGIGAGSSDGAPRADILGTARPDGQVDLGAFESASDEPAP